MVKSDNEIIISLSDLVQAIKRHRFTLLWSTLACCALATYHCLQRPIVYKARGVLITASPSGGATSLGAKFLAAGGLGDSGFVIHDDPQDFIDAYPVAERVVKKLQLQGYLSEKQDVKTYHPIITSLLAFKAKRYFPTQAPSTPFGSVEPCPPHHTLSFTRPEGTLALGKVIYPIDEARTLKLRFLDEDTFEVAGIGKGKIGSPFTHDGYTFTLIKKREAALSNREYTLFLTPLHLAVHKLQTVVKLEKSKKNSRLLQVFCSHSDRALATEVVNAFMQEYINYLRVQGTEKISHQLSYLSQREETILTKLKILIKAQGVYAREALAKGSFSLLGDPQSTSLMYQGACKNYAERGVEIQSTYASLFETHPSLTNIIKEVTEWRVREPELMRRAHTLTSLTGPVLLGQMNQEIATLQLQFQNYDNLCHLLDQEDFELYALSGVATNLLSDGEIARLSRTAAGAHYTAKERAFAIEEMAAEKALIKARLTNLKQLQQSEVASLQERTQVVQKELLLALVRELKIIENDVAYYLTHCGEHVDQLLFEHNVFLNKEVLSKLQGELLMMAEAKNLAYNLESLRSKPFEWAHLPYLPEPPKLTKFGVIGSFLGLFFACAFIVLREISVGPTASISNMNALGRRVVDEDEAVFELMRGGNSWALLTKESHFHFTLAKKMAAAGKKTLLFYLSGKGVSCLERLVIHEERGWASLELGKVADNTVLQGAAFAQLVDALKESYDVILFIADVKLRLVATELGKQLLYVVTDERISELEQLPSETLYLHQTAKSPEKKSLKEIIRSSSFSLKQTSIS